MLPHEPAEFVDLGGDETFELNGFGDRKERREGAATEAVEIIGDGALCGARDAKHSCYPPVLVELETMAIEMLIVVCIVDMKLMRTDTDNGTYDVTELQRA